MKFIFSILIGLISCRSSRSDSPNNRAFLYPAETIVVWNEDTVRSYALTLTKQKKFYTTIIKRDSSNKKEENYGGVFKLSGDTIFLTYNKGLQPTEVTNYLLKEASGNYLIQPFANSDKRMFLRIQRSRPVH